MAHDDKSALVAAVTGIRTVAASAAALLAALGERLRNAIDTDDTDALNALADELNGSKDELAAAIAANTVAQNEPELPPGSPTVVGGEGSDTVGAGDDEDNEDPDVDEGDVDATDDDPDADDTGDDADINTQ